MVALSTKKDLPTAVANELKLKILFSAPTIELNNQPHHFLRHMNQLFHLESYCQEGFATHLTIFTICKELASTRI